MTQHAHARSLRTGRVSEPGRAYLLTAVTAGRAAVFEDMRMARLAIVELRACEELGLCKTLCFVLMPDHLHWLVQLQAGTLQALMRRFKSCSATRINRARLMPGAALWQRGYHDHAVRDGEDIRSMARYVVANPLRAGLVERIADYPHWDAIWLNSKADRE